MDLPDPCALSVTDLCTGFGGDDVLHDICLEVGSGQMVAVIGENGTGKSTLFRGILGLQPLRCGRVRLDGRDISGWPLHRRVAAGLGFLPQHCSSLPSLTGAQVLTSVLELMGTARRERLPRALELLREVDAEALHDRTYGELSGGERRRVEIAKTLATRPRVLLCDEPFAGLDPCIVEQLLRVLRGLADGGAAVLVTDHNAHVLLPAVDAAYLIVDGRVAAHGTPAELATHDVARERYLGSRFVLSR